MNRNAIAFLCMLFSCLFLSGCISDSSHAETGKLKVVASFYPVYDFARNVGGDRVEITTLIPQGIEPHEFEPSPSAIKTISEADVFIYNGAGMEVWVPDLLENVKNNAIVIVDTGKGVQLIPSGSRGSETSDPHIWLNPVNAKIQVGNIRDAFILADPDGREYYEANAQAYIAKLDALESKFRVTISKCRKKDILITHATLAYLCSEYGCRQIPITGINPEAEPSPADVVSIIRQAKENNVSAVFSESMLNPNTAETIAKEINGRVMVFNSVHGLTAQEELDGEDYISLMESNLRNIGIALECD